MVFLRNEPIHSAHLSEHESSKHITSPRLMQAATVSGERGKPQVRKARVLGPSPDSCGDLVAPATIFSGGGSLDL